MDFARRIAPLGGFRNILVHEYLEIDWHEVFDNLQHLDDLTRFGEAIRDWMRRQPAG
ncbi:MAG TPA: HepT-like ribonuclease domain-containing protein [Anaerolineae bacterium]|nr:HepT-like ribonuclease domain-containing protein [Anaerolineae bacterium]